MSHLATEFHRFLSFLPPLPCCSPPEWRVFKRGIVLPRWISSDIRVGNLNELLIEGKHTQECKECHHRFSIAL